MERDAKSKTDKVPRTQGVCRFDARTFWTEFAGSTPPVALTGPRPGVLRPLPPRLPRPASALRSGPTGRLPRHGSRRGTDAETRAQNGAEGPTRLRHRYRYYGDQDVVGLAVRLDPRPDALPPPRRDAGGPSTLRRPGTSSCWGATASAEGLRPPYRSSRRRDPVRAEAHGQKDHAGRPIGRAGRDGQGSETSRHLGGGGWVGGGDGTDSGGLGGGETP